ncbi:hypothetical protein [Streptomyces capitiformicae]|uniref:hypothetical protein n=1 Tax=Streptomyces capitiformicae TaxID=2014920 RepID=UPI0027E53AAE|nr:hypothetical protein [Streptomyces capitiformicae]
MADGHSALRVARGCAPHAVVLDGMLPDLDGVQVPRLSVGSRGLAEEGAPRRLGAGRTYGTLPRGLGYAIRAGEYGR